MSFHLADLTISWTSAFELAPRLLSNSWFLLFSVGPLFWFYLRRLVEPKRGFRWYDALHFIPSVLVLADMWSWVTLPAETRIFYQRIAAEGEVDLVGWKVLAKVAFNISQNLVYLVLSRRLLVRARADVAAVSADSQVLAAMGSLRTFITGFAVWEGAYLVIFAALATFGQFGRVIDAVWLFINGLFLQFSAIQALTRPEYFGATVDQAALLSHAQPPVLDQEPGSDLQEQSSDAGKYRKSSLAPETADQHRQAFEKLMREEKPYLDGTLRLADLASRLGLSPHNLSQVLNQDGYRVDEAKALLKNPAKTHLSVLALAFEAGFNNKNSFNRAFKARVGVTPSAFQKEEGDKP